MSGYFKASFMSVMLTSCFTQCEPSREKMTPLQVLERYIDVSTGMDDVKQRAILLSLTGGALHAALEGATDEAIEEAFIARELELDNFVVISETEHTPVERDIAFLISYYDSSDGKKKDERPLVSVRNTVRMFKQDGVWSVVDVIGAEGSEITFGLTPDAIISGSD
ncbi:MAG: hypothetical protein OYH77_03285 [Pseudomonadota bacterium]|nr:hypothetical protein [Pseudomonadota bacterium]